MAKEEAIEIAGVVEAVLLNTTFRVHLPNGHYVLATIAGKMRRFRLRVLAGDPGTLPPSPHDLPPGRITLPPKRTRRGWNRHAPGWALTAGRPAVWGATRRSRS